MNIEIGIAVKVFFYFVIALITIVSGYLDMEESGREDDVALWVILVAVSIFWPISLVIILFLCIFVLLPKKIGDWIIERRS